MSVRVRSTPRADAQAEAADLWWRANRPAAPDLFLSELRDAGQLLSAMPEAGEVFTARGRSRVRRVLLPRTGYHVYYCYSARTRTATIHAVWAARRGHGPRLPPR